MKEKGFALEEWVIERSIIQLNPLFHEMLAIKKFIMLIFKNKFVV